jgi:hypothetical protein
MKKLLTMLCLLSLTLLVGADDKPKADQPSGDIKGTWEMNGVLTVDRGDTGRGPTLVIGEKEMEWSGKVPYLFDAKGKGTITIDAKKSPATIVLKVGDKVYKGIWSVGEGGKKQEFMQIVLSEAGGDFPKSFKKEELPKDFKGFWLFADREKK